MLPPGSSAAMISAPTVRLRSVSRIGARVAVGARARLVARRAAFLVDGGAVAGLC